MHLLKIIEGLIKMEDMFVIDLFDSSALSDDFFEDIGLVEAVQDRSLPLQHFL